MIFAGSLVAATPAAAGEQAAGGYSCPSGQKVNGGMRAGGNHTYRFYYPVNSQVSVGSYPSSSMALRNTRHYTPYNYVSQRQWVSSGTLETVSTGCST